MEEYAIRCAMWLESRVREAEENDPQLRPLKDKINELTIEIKTAKEVDIPGLLRQQDEVVRKLIDHVSSKAMR